MELFKSMGPVKWLQGHLAAIDRDYKSEKNAPSIIGVSYFSCLMLLLLNYVVINYNNQYESALFIVRTAASLFGDGAGLLLAPHIPLIMKGTWCLGCVLFYFILPGLYLKFVLKRRLVDVGVSPAGFVRHLPLYLLLFVPVFISVWIVSDMQTFQKTYPFYHNPAGIPQLVMWEIMYGIQFFSLEFFFRGFFMIGWREKLGWLAVPIMVIPYCMIHFPKPGLEAAGAIIAGSVLGVVALRTRSIWGGVAIHVTVAWTMDIMSLWRRDWF